MAVSCLCLASLVVCGRHLAPKSSYFSIINRNIIILKVYLYYRCYCLKSLPTKWPCPTSQWRRNGHNMMLSDIRSTTAMAYMYMPLVGWCLIFVANLKIKLLIPGWQKSKAWPLCFLFVIVSLHIEGSTSTETPKSELLFLILSSVYHFPWFLDLKEKNSIRIVNNIIEIFMSIIIMMIISFDNIWKCSLQPVELMFDLQEK